MLARTRQWLAFSISNTVDLSGTIELCIETVFVGRNRGDRVNGSTKMAIHSIILAVKKAQVAVRTQWLTALSESNIFAVPNRDHQLDQAPRRRRSRLGESLLRIGPRPPVRRRRSGCRVSRCCRRLERPARGGTRAEFEGNRHDENPSPDGDRDNGNLKTKPEVL